MTCRYTEPTRKSRSLSPPTVPRDLSPETTLLPVQDLELMHHWTVSASYGFGDRPEDVKPWQVEIPQLACEYPFLLRGILAISALHLSRLRPDRKQRYMMRAAYHQDIALASYRYVIDDFNINMTAENCSAVVGYGNLTCVYGFADFRDPLGSKRSFTNSPLSTINNLPEWLQLLRGSRMILGFGRDWIAKGPMAFQLRRAPDVIDFSLSPYDCYFKTLDTFLNTVEHCPREDIETYGSVVYLLRETAAIPYQPCQTLRIKLAIFRWAEMLPHHFLELIGVRKCEALIILAYFAVLLKDAGKEYWWFNGTAESLIAAIQDSLSQQERRWISWPSSVVNNK